jgi:hypothetical protein
MPHMPKPLRLIGIEYHEFVCITTPYWDMKDNELHHVSAQQDYIIRWRTIGFFSFLVWKNGSTTEAYQMYKG